MGGRLAEINASGFRLAGVAPQLGRPLLPEDERREAPPVIVIGHDVWQTRFGGASTVLGQSMRVGDTERLVVGVMPVGNT